MINQSSTPFHGEDTRARPVASRHGFSGAYVVLPQQSLEVVARYGQQKGTCHWHTLG